MGVALHLPLRRHRDATHADRRIAPRRRDVLARSYERAVKDARAPLAALLRDRDRPVRPEGMRLAEALLCDGDGSLYQWAEPGTLRRRVRVISEAMG